MHILWSTIYYEVSSSTRMSNISSHECSFWSSTRHSTWTSAVPHLYQRPSFQRQVSTRLFADDTIVYRKVQTETDADILQDDLDDLQKWVSTWLMEFNVDKCQLRVTNKRKPINRNYTLNGKQLPLVVEVTVDWKLAWNEHMLLPRFLLRDVTFWVWLPTCNVKIYVRVTHVRRKDICTCYPRAA